MYGQGNYGPQFGHRPNAPMPPAYPHRPLAPPPPPPHFQQGSSAPLPLLNQQAPHAVPPPHVGHPSPHIYHQHGPPAPAPTINQGPPIRVPSGGMPNTGQSYLQIHGSAPLPHMYSNIQQNSQHPSHLGTQNVHHIPPPVPPPPLGPPPSEMLQVPPPPRALPPPPQEQTLYRAPAHPRPQQPGAMQSLQHLPPPPPPPTHSFSSPAQVGSFVCSTVGESQSPFLVPPPPPSSPPPIPPSPPLPTSSVTSSSTPRPVRHIAPDHVGNLNQESGSGSKVGPLARDGTSDLPPPPPPRKPTEEIVVQKIEGLCWLIAKNGHDIEDMTYQSEDKNPEFTFLYGGEPGSEAAIAHEYFLWMKKKCILEYKMHGGKSVSTLTPLKNEYSAQSNRLMVGARCNSPSDSDMEMEGKCL
jgi:hypothetical protein